MPSADETPAVPTGGDEASGAQGEDAAKSDETKTDAAPKTEEDPKTEGAPKTEDAPETDGAAPAEGAAVEGATKAEGDAAEETPKPDEAPAGDDVPQTDPATDDAAKDDEAKVGETPKTEGEAAGEAPKVETDAGEEAPKPAEPSAGDAPKTGEPGPSDGTVDEEAKADEQAPKTEEGAADEPQKAEGDAAEETSKPEEAPAEDASKVEEPAEAGAEPTPKAEDATAEETPKPEEPPADVSAQPPEEVIDAAADRPAAPEASGATAAGAATGPADVAGEDGSQIEVAVSEPAVEEVQFPDTQLDVAGSHASSQAEVPSAEAVVADAAGKLALAVQGAVSEFGNGLQKLPESNFRDAMMSWASKLGDMTSELQSILSNVGNEPPPPVEGAGVVKANKAFVRGLEDGKLEEAIQEVAKPATPSEAEEPKPADRPSVSQAETAGATKANKALLMGLEDGGLEDAIQLAVNDPPPYAQDPDVQAASKILADFSGLLKSPEEEEADREERIEEAMNDVDNVRNLRHQLECARTGRQVQEPEDSWADPDEAAREMEELRRVRRQIRYIFGGAISSLPEGPSTLRVDDLLSDGEGLDQATQLITSPPAKSRPVLEKPPLLPGGGNVREERGARVPVPPPQKPENGASRPRSGGTELSFGTDSSAVSWNSQGTDDDGRRRDKKSRRHHRRRRSQERDEVPEPRPVKKDDGALPKQWNWAEEVVKASLDPQNQWEFPGAPIARTAGYGVPIEGQLAAWEQPRNGRAIDVAARARERATEVQRLERQRDPQAQQYVFGSPTPRYAG